MNQESGPRGGDLTVPSSPSTNTAEWRQSHLNVDLLPNGGMGLHRFVKNEDTATPGRKNEQPWHRMAAYMVNVGRTNSEIALAAGMTVGTVSHLRAQRWFQELCATIANNVGEEVTGAIQSYVLEAVEEIHDIAMTAESDRVRLTALNILLEQGRGKPVQRTVSVVGHAKLSPEDEMAQLLAELQHLRSTSPAPAPELPAPVSITTEKET